MSGGSTEVLTTLYDLLIYWAIALFSAILSKPLRTPPLLFYLLLGAVVGNLHWVNHTEGIEFFAEFAITIVFFSLGFEETVEHFLHGVQKAWGIASIGAAIPFGIGWMSAWIFWPNEGWWVHLTLATCVTATAVSLTMIVLKSVGLLRSKAAMGIMTSAVLDDVGCLVLVAILIPIVVSAAPTKITLTTADPVPSTCLLSADVNATNITGRVELFGSGFTAINANSTAWESLGPALIGDLVSATGAPTVFVSLLWVNLTASDTVQAAFTIASNEFINLNPNTIEAGIEKAPKLSDLPQVGVLYTESAPAASPDATPFLKSYSVDNVVVETKPQTDIVDILWILGKVAIFFLILVLLHNVILPNDIESGPFSYIPGVRSIGMKHLLNVCGGQQVPLIIVTFGLGLGMVGAALGFHPAVGAYFAGLILEEKYFDMFLPDPEDDEDDEEKALIADKDKEEKEGGEAGTPTTVVVTNGNAAKAGGGSPTNGADNGQQGTDDNNADEPVITIDEQQQQQPTPGGRSEGGGGWGTRSQLGCTMEALENKRDSEGEGKDAEEDQEEEEYVVPNTMERAKEAVGSASFLWLGPVFFVNLGANLEVDVDLLATGVPQALAIASMLWVGQFISATLSARFVPGGFTWQESALVGFGMLGRAELFFVVLNLAKTEGIITNKIFFPMALAAMFMNISLPIAISLFRPVFKRKHPEDVDWVEGDPKEEKLGAAGSGGQPQAEPSMNGSLRDPDAPPAPQRWDSKRSNVKSFLFAAEAATPRSESGRSKLSGLGPRKKNSTIGRRGIGLGGFEMDINPGGAGIQGRSPSAIRSSSKMRSGGSTIGGVGRGQEQWLGENTNRTPSRIGSRVGSNSAQRQNRSTGRRRSVEIEPNHWDEPEQPAYMIEAERQAAEENSNPYLAAEEEGKTNSATPKNNEPVS